MKSDYINYYKESQKKHLSTTKKLQNTGKYFVILRLLLFTMLAFGIYFLFSHPYSSNNTYLPLLAIVLFAIVSIFDNKNIKKINLEKELYQLNTTELEHIEGNNSNLDTGIEFSNDNHEYTSDLDIFGPNSLYQAINRCATPIGKEKLAFSLRQTCCNKETLIEKQIATEELSTKPSWRQTFTAKGRLSNINSSDTEEIKEWINKKITIRAFIKPFIAVSPALNIILIVTSSIGLLPPHYPIALSLVHLSIVAAYTKKINTLHKELDTFVKSISEYLPLVEEIHKETFHSEKIKSLKQTLFSNTNNALQGFKTISKILGIFDQRSNILIHVLANAIYLKELYLCWSLEKWKRKYGQHILPWINCIGEIDHLNSIANFYFNNPSFVFPKYDESVIIEAKDMGHPTILADKRVCNDFSIKTLKTFYIVTGANMAGKSTFLRTVGINILLASIGAPVCASEFTFSSINVFSSMRTADNLSQNTSYFQAELIRLKQLMQFTKNNTPTLIILDEILKGTNSIDKLNGSKQFLLKLLNYNVCGLVATHDLLLGDLETAMPETFKNVCFEIEHNSNMLVYDYKLKEGKSKNMNATILLKEMGLI